jgi:hypothetical protein
VSNANANQTRDVLTLLLGAAMVASCIAVAHFAPATFQAAFFQMRVLTALGGALLGTALPGIVGIELKGIRAIGAASFVVLFFLFAPLSAASPPRTETTTSAATKDSPPVHNDSARNPSSPVRAQPVEPAQAADRGTTAESVRQIERVVNSPVCQGDQCSQNTTYYQQHDTHEQR